MASKQEPRRRQKLLNDALFIAAEYGLLEDIQSLLDRQADVNALGANGATPLHNASSNAHHQCVALLLDRHADINASGCTYIKYTPLHYASMRGNRRCIQILLDYGADKSLTTVRPL